MLLVRTGAGHALRRGADQVETGVPGPDDRTGWDRVVLTRGRLGLVDELLGYGDQVYVESPAHVRGALVERLSLALGREL